MTAGNTGGEPSWQCGNCKTWVPYNTSHVCPTQPYNPYTQPYTQYYGYGYIDNTILERIAKALEELVKLKSGRR